MSWLLPSVLLSILAALTWAVVNVADKYILTKWVRNPIVPVMILGVIGLAATIPVYVFNGFSYLSYQNIALAFVAGVFYVLMAVFYFKAVKIEEISRVVPLLYLTPLFVLILAAVFLGEIFGLVTYAGIFLLIIGAVLISSKNPLKIRPGKAFWLMVLASLSIAVNNILTKYLLGFADFWTVFSYTKIGAIFALIPVFYFSLPDLVLTAKKHGRRVIAIISLNESLNLVGGLLITVAMAVGYVTLVNSLSSVQPFFVMLFAIVLSVFYPKILKEEISGPMVLVKAVAIVLMFAGAILIT